MSQYRLAARVARREVRRRPWRTLLVALLVAFPVAAMVLATVIVRTEHLTPMQRWRTDFGHADALNAPEGSLPPGSHVVSYRSVYALLRAGDAHRSFAIVTDLPMRDHITDGMVQLTSGRPPRAANEVFLTRETARDLHVGLGDELPLQRPQRRTFRVVGVGEMASSWDQREMIVGPGAAFPWASAEDGGTTHLAAFPRGTRASDLRTSSLSALSPEWAPQSNAVTNLDANRKVRWSWVIGAVVLTVVGIVIAAAFAAGARRQLVTLGQLSANGASPATARRVLFLQGTWTGVVGSTLGLVLGALMLLALSPHVERVVRHEVGSYRVRALDLVPIVLLGVAAATIAALVPARTTSRVPVLAALAGRRPLGRVPRWVPVAGTLTTAAGLGLLGLAVVGGSSVSSDGRSDQVWVLTGIAGGIAILLGACAIAPAYVSCLGAVSTRTRGALRLASRSLARQRTRTGAVVSAVAATSALVILTSSFVSAAHAEQADRPEYMRDDEVQVFGIGTAPPARFVQRIAAVLPRSRRYEVPAARETSTWALTDAVRDDGKAISTDGDRFGIGEAGTAIAVVDDATARLIGLDAADRAVLRRSGAIVLGPTRGHATLQPARTLPRPTPPGGVKQVAPGPSGPNASGVHARVPMVDGSDYQLGVLPNLFVTPAFARRLHVTGLVPITVVRARKSLTEDQRNELREVLDDARVDDIGKSGVWAEFYQPSTSVDPLLVDTILIGVALFLVLFVVAVNLALSAAETRDERDALAVVGASPATTRRTNGYKALILTALGTVLAVPVGYLPYLVFIGADSSNDLPLVFPWRIVTVLVVAVPLIAALVTTAGSATALFFRPVRVSKMAFD